MILQDFTIDTFYGLNTDIKDIRALRKGFSPDSKNWITGGKKGDHIELRRGYANLGTTRNTEGDGKVTGLGVGLRYDGVEVPFFTHGRKAKYYDVDTDDVIEIGTDLFTVEASGDDFWIRPYQNLAGSFIYLGAENSTIFKIPVANPESAVDQVTASYRFGVFHFGLGRSFAGKRKGTSAGNEDKTGLYLSYIDKDSLADYTQTTAEAFGTGDGTATEFSHTAAVIGSGKTLMYPSITDSVETFVDDRNGNLVGNQGGTGTINYSTGEMVVNFNTAVNNSQAITCSYYNEVATDNGVLDFSGSSNGQGKVFRQDSGGGNIESIFNFNTIEYSFHQLKTWQLAVSLDDTGTTNLPYRNVGIPYKKAAFETPSGILFADVSRPAEPKFRMLQVLAGTNNTTIEPISISDNLDLSQYGYDYCLAFRWGDYNIFAVQKRTNATVDNYNSVMFIQNTLSGAWDRVDYDVSCLDEYNGTLIAGDFITNNLMTLFSGYDDDGDVINNYWTTSDLDLNTDNLKDTRRMVIEGLIQKGQSYTVSLSLDGGTFAEYYTIFGNGSYVDSGINTHVGSSTIGSKIIGGGGGDTAHPYSVDFPLNTGKYTHCRVKIEALDVGYVSIDSITFKDNRDKGRKRTNVKTA